MIRSFDISLTGLTAHQDWLDILSDNIANINTHGYKRSRMTFQETLSVSLDGAFQPSSKGGGINPKQMGFGVETRTIDVIHTQGLMEETGKATDLAINGNGFFILSDPYSHYCYTRSGNFDFDKDGNLVNPANGMFVKGWMGRWDDLEGRRYIQPGGSLENIQIQLGSILKARPTDEISLEGNLNVDMSVAIDPIDMKKTVSLRSLSQVVDGDGSSLSLIADIQAAGWNTGRNPDPTSFIKITTSDGAEFESKPLNNTNYSNLNDLIKKINEAFSYDDFFKYDPTTDMFTITPYKEGITITLEEKGVTSGIGFWTAINMPSGTHDPNIKEKIKFTHLMDAQHPDREYYRWEALDPATGEPVPMVESAVRSVLSTGPNGTSKVSANNVPNLDITQPFTAAGFDITPNLNSRITIRSSAYASAGGEGIWTSRSLSEYTSIDQFIAEVNNQDSAPVTLTYSPLTDTFTCYNDAPGTAVIIEESVANGFVTIAKFQVYSQDHGANYLWNGQTDVDFTRSAAFRATTLPAKGILRLDPITGKVIESYIDTDENQNNVLDRTSEIPGITAIITLAKSPPRLFGGDLWSHATSSRGLGKDFYRGTNGQIRESVWVDTPTAGSTITINLDRNDINGSAIVVTANQTFIPADPANSQGTWRFSDNTGPKGVDQIIFTPNTAWESQHDVLFEINYVRLGYSSLKPSDTFIPNGNEGPEDITFMPNTGNITDYRYYSADDMANNGFVEMAKAGLPATADRQPKDEYIYSVSREIYDSLGNAISLRFNFERIDTNYWLWWVRNPSEDANYPEGLLSGYGILTFNYDGTYNRPYSETFQSPSDPATFDGDNGDSFYGKTMGYRGIYIDPPSLAYPKDFGGSPPPERGATVIKLDPDFKKIHQYAGGNEVAIDSSGYGMGILEETTINETGIIWGNYSNKQQQPLAQIALATFSNPGGLSHEAGTIFKVTANSGAPEVTTPGTGLAGIISSKRLEKSNVDLADEFGKMIIAERGFMANSRGITTADRIIMDIMRLRM